MTWWNWRSLADYLDSIAPARLAINIAPLIGHGALRAAELDTMTALMREAMEQGAFGLSTSLDSHQYPAGLPYGILNGRVVVDQGRYTGALAGSVVRKTV